MDELPRAILAQVIAVVEEAGAMLATEFLRPDGPRGITPSGTPDKADIDVELELFLRERLLSLVPARFVGEECGIVECPGSAYCWLVDPQDGTRAFLQGRRGSAVSVALLRDGVPVLGVVFAPYSPDLGPDLIAWAEGMDHLLRNGAELRVDLSQRDLNSGEFVYLSHHSPHRPVTNGERVAPARFIAMPSIAYRMARIAAGDGVGTVSTSGPGDLDYAAGHALLRGAGGIFVDQTGAEVTYTRDGASRVEQCFAGAPRAVRKLATRNWIGSNEARQPARTLLTWPRMDENRLLKCAQGCLLGQLAGDSLGALAAGKTPAEIAGLYPAGVRQLRDGGTWNLLAGQPTSVSELAMALARILVEADDFDAEAVAIAYGSWYASHPFDIDATLRVALAPASRAARGCAEIARSKADRHSQGNGSLMRVSPIGIWAASTEQAAACAMADSDLTHPHPVCVIACGAYAGAIAAAIGGGDPADMLNAARRIAEDGAGQDGGVIARALEAAANGHRPTDYVQRMGWVVVAFQNAFFHLLHTADLADALSRTISEGGDTATNAGVAGALAGAYAGRSAILPQWMKALQSCRPDKALGAQQFRPAVYWPDDALDLAEALLACQPRGFVLSVVPTAELTS